VSKPKKDMFRDFVRCVEYHESHEVICVLPKATRFEWVQARKCGVKADAIDGEVHRDETISSEMERASTACAVQVQI
jgi:hypothetical protein